MLLRAVALIGASMLVVACQDSGVTVQSVGSTAATPSNSVSSASPTATSSEESATTSATESASSASEQADRTAAEAQWIKSWDVYLAMPTTPPEEREALAATVTVDPAKSRMLADAAEFDGQGLQTYGQIEHVVFWTRSINGENTALIDDCQDRSATGSMETASGNKVTVGVAGRHYQGQMVRGADGVWRVSESFFLKDEPC